MYKHAESKYQNNWNNICPRAIKSIYKYLNNIGKRRNSVKFLVGSRRDSRKRPTLVALSYQMQSIRSENHYIDR